MNTRTIIKRDVTAIVDIIEVYDYKSGVHDDGSNWSLQMLRVNFESGNITMLKIWNRENYHFKSGHLIKVDKANNIREVSGEYDFVNIHTTEDSTIVYPYSPQTKIVDHIPTAKKSGLAELENRLDTLQNIVADYTTKFDNLEQAFKELVNIPKIKKLLPQPKKETVTEKESV